MSWGVANVSSLLGVPGLEGDLPRIESALRASVTSADAFLSEVAGHLMSAGGKRIRPALSVAAALAGGVAAGTVSDDVIQGGIAVELVHTGSLCHDDVIDESDQRRSVPTANARWGNLVAILSGDFLLARASEIAASLGTEVAALLGHTIARLCEGEIGQLQTAFNVGRSEDAYYSSIRGKTASLLSASCRIGAITAGLPRESIDALTEFGDAFGMAFQIYDDVLDLIATEEELGKPAGHDMVEGVYTLPVLRALADPLAGGDLRAMLGSPLDAVARDRAKEIVRSTTGIEQSIAVGREWADRAVAAMAPLGESPAAAGLGAAGHRLLDLLVL
jgi:heptaprenyl diphosphate synthase